MQRRGGWLVLQLDRVRVVCSGELRLNMPARTSSTRQRISCHLLPAQYRCAWAPQARVAAHLQGRVQTEESTPLLECATHSHRWAPPPLQLLSAAAAVVRKCSSTRKHLARCFLHSNPTAGWRASSGASLTRLQPALELELFRLGLLGGHPHPCPLPHTPGELLVDVIAVYAPPGGHCKSRERGGRGSGLPNCRKLSRTRSGVM